MSHERPGFDVGDLIVLDAHRMQPAPPPEGFAAELMQLEVSLGNVLVESDLGDSSPGGSRFWLQDPLHLKEIDRTQGYVCSEESQTIIAPAALASVPASPVRRSWKALRGR